MAALASDGPSASELDGTLRRELESVTEILGAFTFERVQLVNRTITHETAFTEQAVIFLQELEREIEVSPALQLSRIEIAALQVPILRLRGCKDVRLIIRFKDQELLP